MGLALDHVSIVRNKEGTVMFRVRLGDSNVHEAVSPGEHHTRQDMLTRSELPNLKCSPPSRRGHSTLTKSQFVHPNPMPRTLIHMPGRRATGHTSWTCFAAKRKRPDVTGCKAASRAYRGTWNKMQGSQLNRVKISLVLNALAIRPIFRMWHLV